MKKLLLTILAIIMIGGCVYVQPDPNYYEHKTRYYNSHGMYDGYSIETPYRTRYYDSKSRYKGYSKEAK